MFDEYKLECRDANTADLLQEQERLKINIDYFTNDKVDKNHAQATFYKSQLSIVQNELKRREN